MTLYAAVSILSHISIDDHILGTLYYLLTEILFCSRLSPKKIGKLLSHTNTQQR